MYRIMLFSFFFHYIFNIKIKKDHRFYAMTYFYAYLFKTTYMLTFPWESFLPCVRSSAVTSRLRRSVPFAPQMFSPFHVHHSTSKLAPWCPFHGLTAFSLFGQALDRLVTVSSIHYCTSTSVLSTSFSLRGLKISHLEGGFTLRCLQRLSLPDLATRP